MRKRKRTRTENYETEINKAARGRADLIDRYVHFYNHERIQTKLERRRWRRSTPLKS